MTVPPPVLDQLVSRFDASAFDAPAGSARLRLRVDDVGDAEHSADERAGHEPALHRHREPGQSGAADRELAGDGRCGCGRGKPQRHGKKLARGDQREHQARHWLQF